MDCACRPRSAGISAGSIQWQVLNESNLYQLTNWGHLSICCHRWKIFFCGPRMSDWSFGSLAASKTYLIDLSHLTGAYEKSPPVSRWWWYLNLNTFLKLPWIISQIIFHCVQGPAEVQTLFLILCLLLTNEMSSECDQQVPATGSGTSLTAHESWSAPNRPCV